MLSSELIRSALPTATDTKVVVAEPGAVSATPQVFRDCFADATAIVVGDERTMTVAGNAVVAELTAAGTGWVNLYRCFSKEPVWPRGFPLEHLQDVVPPDPARRRRAAPPAAPPRQEASSAVTDALRGTLDFADASEGTGAAPAAARGRSPRRARKPSRPLPRL